MPASWLPSGLPKIQTDFKALRQSQRTRKLQIDLHESPSTSSSSRSSSFIITPSTSHPHKAQFSPLNGGDDLYCISDAAAPTGASSTLTLQPVKTKVAHNSPHHLDRGATRHSKGLSPFEKTDHCTTGRGPSNTRTSSGHSAASVDTRKCVKGVDCNMSPREDPSTQTTHSSHQPTLGLSRGPRRLSFPQIRRRDVYDSNDAGSSSSHATSQPGSPTVALSRSSSLRSRKYKLGSHRFLVSQKVGEGGFGQVYKAIEIHTGHIVAVKTVSRKGLSRSRVNATLKEQRVAGRIAKHQREACDNGGDFVVRMLASFLTLNHFVFVLDYHGAGDLRDVDFPLKTEHARFYIGEMALGLRFIHSLDIVLRDLKPANVLLGFDGHIKLADFGLSAMSEQVNESTSSGAEAERPTSVLSFVRTRTISLGSSSLNIPTLNLGNRKRSKTTSHVPKFFKTSSSKRRSSERQRCPMVFCGTPGYISPEGYKGRYGPENDMWALGISLYEFITGENPFDMWGVPTSEIQRKVEDADIYYPEGMPTTTQDVIGQLLKRKWQNRMTIEELMEHQFFLTDDFSWEELRRKKLTPPPLPDIALRRLRQSQAAESQQPQVPLILHLEAEAMRMKDGFVEELGAQEMCDFEMDGLDILPSLKEERRVEGSEDDVWW